MLKIRSPSFCQNVYKRLYHKGVAPFRQPHFLKSEKICIRDKYGEFSYQEINQESDKIARALVKSQKNSSNEANSNVAFLTSNTHQYTVSQFGIWKGGLSCVPLCKSHPAETLKYYIEDSKVKFASLKLNDLCMCGFSGCIKKTWVVYITSLDYLRLT